MDKINNLEITTKKNEADILSNYVKCEINDCDNSFNQKHIEGIFTVQTTGSIKKENLKTCEDSKHVDFESDVVHKHEGIKIENIKVEPDLDSLTNDQTSKIEHNSSRMIAFLKVQYMKDEETNEYDNEEVNYDTNQLNEGIFTCNICQGAFITAEYCQKHETRCRSNIYMHQSTSTDNGSTFAELYKDNDEVKLYKCDKCSEKFKTSVGLSSHMGRHSGVGLHTCPVCHKQFTLPSNLTRHMRVHSQHKPHKCTLCGRVFSEKSTLITHMRTHTGERPFKCTLCEKAFSQSTSLTEHMRSHTGERPYKCQLCDKTFTLSCNLTVHMRTHRGERFKCTLCERTYSQSKSLSRHMMAHTGEKPYSCSQCNKGFKIAGDMEKHMRIHSGKRPFKCTQCNKSFTQAHVLSNHIRSHSGEKPYECWQCNKAFTMSGHLKRHLKVHETAESSSNVVNATIQ